MWIKRVGVTAFAMIAIVAAGLTATAHAAPAEAGRAESQLLAKSCPETTSHPEISIGSTGIAVKHAQCLMNQNFGGTLIVDGVFGPATRGEVVHAQKTCGIPVDGIVGPLTWTCLHDGP
jgi:zinc D-Ala-D-Ala carboxypeptidase